MEIIIAPNGDVIIPFFPVSKSDFVMKIDQASRVSMEPYKDMNPTYPQIFCG